MNEPVAAPKPRKGLLIWLVISQALALGTLVIWLLMAGLSVMAFDSGVTTEAWAFVIAVWSYPILPIGLSIGAWIAYAKRKNTLAAILSGLSFGPPLLCMLVIVLADLAWFATYNGGGIGVTPFAP